MNRREFLKSAAGFCAFSLLCPGIEAWALSKDNSSAGGNKLIVVFLRGAVDGLNVVVPWGDTQYYSARPSIAIARPGEQDGAINLDSYFGLHPSLQPLMPYWQDGTLAFVHAVGSPDPTRSHFDAQDYMESGTPGIKGTSSGWLNRLLEQLPDPRSPVRAINLGETLPRILMGKVSVASYAPAGKNALRARPIDYPVVSQYFQSMYSGRSDELGKAFNEGLSAHQRLKKDFEGEMQAANQGAPDARSFKGFGSQIGALFVKEPTVQIGFLAIGGWDTHVNQGGGKGQLANKLSTLGQGLAEMVAALGDVYKSTLIVVMSEFGRTVKENGNGGTDHGHGNMMMLLGGGISGRKIYGNWPGLGASRLYEGRDVPVATDFRSVLTAAVGEHMSIARTGMADVFPSFAADTGGLRGIFRG